MRFRTVLLFACMIIVPLLAMFSHRIPPGLRSMAREQIWEPVQRTFAGLLDNAGPGRPAVPAQASMAVVGEAGPNLARRAPMTVPTIHPEMRLAPEPPAPPPAIPVRTVTAGAQELPRSPAWPPAPEPVQTMESEIRVRQRVEKSLAALGAISFDCQPLQGADGLHRCSCRVAADPTGQLQRVFQASGPDPMSAMSHLLEQVTEWKQRMASRSDRDPPPSVTRF